VFCSVDDPVRGLREAARVLRPDGELLLYEHVRPDGRVTGRIADAMSPLTRRLIGPELNRRTEDNLTAAGLHLQDVRRRGIWREIVATTHSVPAPR
jgi:ubiquinone/menaquinone biosynthesis C-methylase UbiE